MMLLLFLQSCCLLFHKKERSGLLMDAILCVFLLSSQFRSSFVSVVFDFSASLNDVAPVSPILFPVDLIMVKACVLLMDVICVLFLLSSPNR